MADAVNQEAGEQHKVQHALDETAAHVLSYPKRHVMLCSCLTSS
jgi:hypothetical protein